jgi:hypothetical protein
MSARLKTLFPNVFQFPRDPVGGRALRLGSCGDGWQCHRFASADNGLNRR